MILDTNVVSIAMRRTDQPHAILWLNEQEPATPFMTSVTVAEITKGIAVDINDGYISGIAAAHKMMVATRDTVPFEAMGIQTINPWV